MMRIIWILFLLLFCGCENSYQESNNNEGKTKPTNDERAVKIKIKAKETKSNKIALVIGNSNYVHLNPLPNPVNDADKLSEALVELGFEVEVVLNSNHEDMEKAVSRFGERLEKGNVGLFFYAGHGIQVDGYNYLVPVGANISDVVDVKHRTVDLNFILEKMENAKNKTNLIFLDACRDNPFKKGKEGEVRGQSEKLRGLAYTSAPSGSLIVYATAPGDVAADGNKGENSPFTKALLERIKTPGLEIRKLIQEVRNAVKKETSGKQVPWESSSLEGDFYFVDFSKQIKDKEQELAKYERVMERQRLEEERQKEQEEEAKSRLSKLETEIEKIRNDMKMPGNKASKLVEMEEVVIQKSKWKKTLELLEKERLKQEQEHIAELERAKIERTEAARKIISEKLAIYQRIVASEFGKEMQENAWKAIVEESPGWWNAKEVAIYDEKVIMLSPEERIGIYSKEKRVENDTIARTREKLQQIDETITKLTAEMENLERQKPGLEGMLELVRQKNALKEKISEEQEKKKTAETELAKAKEEAENKLIATAKQTIAENLRKYREIITGEPALKEMAWTEVVKKCPEWWQAEKVEKYNPEEILLTPKERLAITTLYRIEVEPASIVLDIGESVTFKIRGYNKQNEQIEINEKLAASYDGGSMERSKYKAGNTPGSYLLKITSKSGKTCTASITIRKKEEYPGFTYLRERTYSCNGQSYTVKEYKHEQTGMEFAALPAGEFMMGGDKYDSEKPIHKVRVSSFLIAKTEVPQSVWQKIMNTSPWRGKSYVKEGGNFAASYVSWNDSQEFCKKTGLALPTEAEWEYACRSGSSDTYYWGNNMDGDYAWFYDNARKKGEEYAHEVAQKKANAFGLYDMSGNVWEWCADWYDSDYYKNSPMDNPRGPSSGSSRVLRGGSWNSDSDYCRSAIRFSDSPEYTYYFVGFRPVYNFQNN